MRASLLLDLKRFYSDGAIVQIRVWQVPPDEERRHGLKYSLFYGFRGRRVVGYDNERGKGDHRHYPDQEEPYEFVELERLLADFQADVARLRGR